MKNLRHYPNPPIEVYLSALDGKKDEEMVDRLVPFEDSIRNSYDSYHQCFLDNNLQAINANEIFDPHSEQEMRKKCAKNAQEMRKNRRSFH